MTDEIVLWHNPRCSTSRGAMDLLDGRATTRPRETSFSGRWSRTRS